MAPLPLKSTDSALPGQMTRRLCRLVVVLRQCLDGPHGGNVVAFRASAVAKYNMQSGKAVRIDARADLATHDVENSLRRQSLSIRPRGAKRIANVGRAQHTRGHRQRLFCDPTVITPAIEALVMRGRDIREVPETSDATENLVGAMSYAVSTPYVLK